MKDQSSSFDDDFITPIGLTDEPERDERVHAKHGASVVETSDGKFGGEFIKKPYKRNMKIGWPRKRYLVLCEQNKFTWYKDYQSFTNGEAPHGSITLTPKTQIRLPLTPDKKYFSIVNPSDPKFPLELYSTDPSKTDQDWIEALRGRLNFLRFGDKCISDLRKGEITIFSASSDEGRSILEAFLKSDMWERSSRIKCIVGDEYAVEEVNDIVGKYPQKKHRVAVELIDYNDLKTLRNVVEDTKIAIITVPFRDTETRLRITSNYIDAIKGKKCFTIMISAVLAEMGDRSCQGKSFYEIEQKLKNSNMFYCILRLVYFMETLGICAGDIQNERAMHLPIDSEKPFSVIALEDAGDAVVHLTTDLDNIHHENSTYTLAGPSINPSEFVELLNQYQTSDEKIEYSRCSMEKYVNSGVAMGLYEWAMKEREEYFGHVKIQDQLINDHSSDLEKLIKRKPKSIKQWVEEHKDQFL